MCDENGELTAEFLCEDGLVFDTISQQCGLPFRIGCEQSGRLLQQLPDPVGNCPRRNGKWAVDNTCNQYVECKSGIESLVTCQNHLVFDEQSGECDHPDIANREGCTAEDLYEFDCPISVGQARYGAETDCRAFFTCASYTNYHPRLGGCPFGMVYNEVSQICDDPDNVPKCKDYYQEDKNSESLV